MTGMGKVLVTEQIADAGLAVLQAAGHTVDVRLGLGPEDLAGAIVGAHGLIIRSATQVDASLIDAGRELVVIGRAGIGLDNVDVAAATRRGVMVANAPQSNIISAAEHTMALLLAQARNVPQAHAALVAGRWERSRWEGVELHGKTLGIVGLGRVGALVAHRAASFGMHLVAYDPFVASERCRQLGAEALPLDELVRRSDFLTIHLPKTPETIGLIGIELIGLAKPGLRIINVARGGIVDEVALAEALVAGTIAGAALDVFVAEPTTASPLFQLDQVVVTPHLGASTREAQDKAGLAVAEQVNLALDGQLVPFAVNVPASEMPEGVAPFVPLAEQLGRLWASLVSELPAQLHVEYQGGLADADTRLLTLSVLRGVWLVAGDEPVSWVNAAQIADERGLEVRSTTASATHDYVNLLTVRGGGHAVAGTIFTHNGVPRIVMVDDHDLELPLARWILVVRNDDSIGVVAAVTSVIAQAGLNIVDLKLGRGEAGGTAMMALSFEQAIPAEVVKSLAATHGVLDVALLADL